MRNLILATKHARIVQNSQELCTFSIKSAFAKHYAASKSWNDKYATLIRNKCNNLKIIDYPFLRGQGVDVN